jgi:hypothetical protein
MNPDMRLDDLDDQDDFAAAKHLMDIVGLSEDQAVRAVLGMKGVGWSSEMDTDTQVIERTREIKAEGIEGLAEANKKLAEQTSQIYELERKTAKLEEQLLGALSQVADALLRVGELEKRESGSPTTYPGVYPTPTYPGTWTTSTSSTPGKTNMQDMARIIDKLRETSRGKN